MHSLSKGPSSFHSLTILSTATTAAAEARGATKILGYHNKNFYQVTKREHSHEDPISFDSS